MNDTKPGQALREAQSYAENAAAARWAAAEFSITIESSRTKGKHNSPRVYGKMCDKALLRLAYERQRILACFGAEGTARTVRMIRGKNDVRSKILLNLAMGNNRRDAEHLIEVWLEMARNQGIRDAQKGAKHELIPMRGEIESIRQILLQRVRWRK